MKKSVKIWVQHSTISEIDSGGEGMRLSVKVPTFVILSFFMWAMGGEAPVKTPQASVELISDTQTIVPGQSFWVAVKFTVSPGWHIYWRNSGDSGMPTQIAWDLPPGFQVEETQWAPPEKIRRSGVISFGHAGDVYHFAKIVPLRHIEGSVYPIHVNVQWLACGDVCVPEAATLTLQLPVSGKQVPSSYAALMQEHQKRLPKPLGAGLKYAVRDGEAVVRIPHHLLKHIIDQLPSGTVFAPEVHFFPYEAGTVPAHAKITYHKTQDFLDIYIPLNHTAADAVLPLLEGVIQMKQGVEVASFILRAEPTASFFEGNPNQEASHTSTISSYVLLVSVLSAFLGGVILNVMPCVFPILSLKILGIQQEGHSKARSSAFFYTLGVLVSFCALALCLAVLRMAGESVGWGFQMQSSIFVSVLVYVFVVMGMGLSGFMHFPMLAPATGGVQRVQNMRAQNFLLGVLAVGVATPCTAPFMGAAMGVALMQPLIVMLLIFLSLGLGFAAPYVLVACVPVLARCFPKPGPWMEKMKGFLAFPLYLSAIWLMWILIQQKGARGFLVVSLGVVGVVFALWLWRSFQHKGVWLRAAIAAFALCMFVSSLVALSYDVQESTVDETTPHVFTRERFEKLRAQGKPVFVNVTAAWCLTCQANEFFLASVRVRELFKRQGVTYLEADWTMQDPEITAFLEKFRRTGVPLYVYFPRVGEPVVLPQILSERSLLKACAE